MILLDLTDRVVGDVVHLCGTPYTIVRIVAQTAYARRHGTAGKKEYLIQPEGKYFTVSEIKGDRTMPWTFCGVLHYLKPLDIYPGLE